MTSFPNTDGPSGRLRRADDRSLPRVGIDRVLIAPGETPSVNGGSSARAEQLASFLDSVVGLGGTYLQIRAQRAAEDAQRHDALLAEDARIADALEQQAAAVTKQKRGLGERDARAKLPLLQQEIAGDKLQIPPGADPVTFTREYLSAQFDGVDPEYQDAAVALIENDVVKAFADRQDELAKVAVKDSLSLMGQELIGKTPEHAIETLSQARAFPGASDIPDAQIREIVILPAMQYLSQNGRPEDVKKFASLLNDKVKSGQLELEAQKVVQDATAKRKAEAVSYIAALTEATKDPSGGQTYEGLLSAIENLRGSLGDSLTNEKLAEARIAAAKDRESQIVSAQERAASQVFALAEIGGLTRDELQSNYLPRTQLPKTDPNYLSPEQYRTIDGRIKDKKVESESSVRVAAALSGAPAVLTADDSSEYEKALKKANVISPNGVVTNPTLLAAASASTNFLPAGVVDSVQNSIRSSDPVIAGNGIEAAGLLAASDEAFYAKLASGLPEGETSIVAASAKWARDGLYGTPEGRQRVAADLAVLRQRVADLKEITREERSKISLALQDKFAKDTPAKKILDKEITKLFEEERSRVGYTKDPGWIIDLDPDPTLELNGPGVMETAERAYAEHFAKASRTLPPQDAANAAYAYAQGQIREKFDFVRFNNRVFPVPLENVAGGMPDAMRWGPNMEEDMKAALADPKVNVKPDDVASFIPLTLPTSGGNRTGWAIVLRDNTLVRNDLGIPLLVTPTPEQERRNIEYRKRAAKYKQGGWNWLTGYGVSGAAQRIADDVTGTNPL